jgi:hypothetical protein
MYVTNGVREEEGGTTIEITADSWFIHDATPSPRQEDEEEEITHKAILSGVANERIQLVFGNS